MSDWMFRQQAMADAENEKWLQKRPICSWCEEHIQDDYAYEIDNKLICPNCIDEFKVDLDY